MRKIIFSLASCLFFFLIAQPVSAQSTCAPTRIINQFGCVSRQGSCSRNHTECSGNPGVPRSCGVGNPCPPATGSCVTICDAFNVVPSCEATGSITVGCNQGTCSANAAPVTCSGGGGGPGSCTENTSNLTYSCWVTNPPPPGGGGPGGGSCPACFSLSAAPNNCGEVGRVDGSGSCGAGERCCGGFPGGGASCIGTATVCFNNDSCDICGAGQCCTTGDTGVAGNCRIYTAAYPYFCGAVTNYCGQNFSCGRGGTHPCPNTQAIRVAVPPANMSPADNSTVTPALTCNAACVNSIDCGSHWVQGTLDRGGGTLAKYRRMVLDAVVPTGETKFEEQDARVGKTKGFAGWGPASFSGGFGYYTDNEFASFWFPVIGGPANILTYKENIGSLMELAIDGKVYGSVTTNSVDDPPVLAQYPITVPVGPARDFICQAGACRLRSIPSDPVCNDTPTTHLYRIVNKRTPGKTLIDLDAIVEDGVKMEQTDPRIQWGPALANWAFPISANHSGGSERYTSAINSSFTFSSSASNIQWITTTMTNRGDADVYVDGVLSQTINLTSPGWAYQVAKQINVPAGTKPALNGAETSVLLSWSPNVYSRFKLEVYPAGTSCSDPRAYCGTVVRPNYRLVPAPGVSQYVWRVAVLNDLCVNFNKRPVDGTWSPFYTFNLNVNVDVPGTVAEDPTGTSVLVGGVCQASSTAVYRGGGTVRLTGNSQNKSAAVSTTDGSYTITAVPGNTGYTLSFSPSSTAYGCSCPAGCTYTGVTIPEPTDLPFYVTPIANPWTQTVGGDVGAFASGVGFSVQDPIPIATCVAPGCVSYLSLPLVAGNQATSGSLVVQSSTQVDLKNTTNGPQNDNVAQTSRLVRLTNPFIPKENYDYFYRLYSLGLTPSDDFIGGGRNPAAATKPNGNPANGKTAFYRNGDLTITSPWSLNNNDSIVIFVNGNLNINSTITVPTAALPQKPFLGFIVSGNITIGSNVGTATFASTSNGQVQGFYLADGQILVPTVGAAGTDLKLVAEGTFAAGGGISIKRDFRNGGNGLMNNEFPVALFTYRPDIFRSVPDRMKVPLTVWKEATP